MNTANTPGRSYTRPRQRQRRPLVLAGRHSLLLVNLLAATSGPRRGLRETQACPHFGPDLQPPEGGDSAFLLFQPRPTVLLDFSSPCRQTGGQGRLVSGRDPLPAPELLSFVQGPRLLQGPPPSSTVNLTSPPLWVVGSLQPGWEGEEPVPVVSRVLMPRTCQWSAAVSRARRP